MSARQRLTFAVIAALIAVVAVIVLAGSGDDAEEPATVAETPTATATPQGTVTAEPEETATPEPTPDAERIRVRGGRPVGGEADLRFKQGDTVRFTVTSDTVDHVHLHGYDIVRDVGPGRDARFSFKADITGVFEVELEDTHVPVARLRVDP